MDGVEHLYKSFGVLADAKEKAGEVGSGGNIDIYKLILNAKLACC